VKDTKTVHQALQAIDDINLFIQALRQVAGEDDIKATYAHRKPYGVRVLLENAIFE
jgi:predicted hydrolase (HD superfamily)